MHDAECLTLVKPLVGEPEHYIVIFFLPEIHYFALQTTGPPSPQTCLEFMKVLVLSFFFSRCFVLFVEFFLLQRIFEKSLSPGQVEQAVAERSEMHVFVFFFRCFRFYFIFRFSSTLGHAFEAIDYLRLLAVTTALLMMIDDCGYLNKE